MKRFLDKEIEADFHRPDQVLAEIDGKHKSYND